MNNSGAQRLWRCRVKPIINPQAERCFHLRALPDSSVVVVKIIVKNEIELPGMVAELGNFLGPRRISTFEWNYKNCPINVRNNREFCRAVTVALAGAVPIDRVVGSQFVPDARDPILSTETPTTQIFAYSPLIRSSTLPLPAATLLSPSLSSPPIPAATPSTQAAQREEIYNSAADTVYKYMMQYHAAPLMGDAINMTAKQANKAYNYIRSVTAMPHLDNRECGVIAKKVADLRACSGATLGSFMY
jgi:hypothetical protein